MLRLSGGMMRQMCWIVLVLVAAPAGAQSPAVMPRVGSVGPECLNPHFTFSYSVEVSPDASDGYARFLGGYTHHLLFNASSTRPSLRMFEFGGGEGHSRPEVFVNRDLSADELKGLLAVVDEVLLARDEPAVCAKTARQVRASIQWFCRNRAAPVSETRRPLTRLEFSSPDCALPKGGVSRALAIKWLMRQIAVGVLPRKLPAP
jgi:hypothetical protein